MFNFNFLSMVQFKSLSETGRNIVENFISEKKNLFLSSKKKMELMTSLYAMMGDAKAEVLNILHDYVKDLSVFFSKEDIEILISEYPAVMHYCFERKDSFNEATYYVDKNGYNNKMLPKSLLELCNKIASPEKGDNVFLPYADFAQLAFLLPEANYFGFELNEERWALSQMMFHSSGISSSIILTGDMHEAMPKDKLFDYVFSMPPFLTGKESRGIVDNIYELATKHLSDKGVLCCILPENFCYASSGWFDVRKILLDYRNKYSAIVITLPQLPNMFSSSRLCVFCLIKDGKGDVILMDASRNDAFMVVHDPAYYDDWYINADSIIATLNHGSSDFVKVGNVGMLNNSLDFTPSHYLVKNILPEPNSTKGEVRYRIGDLIDIVSTEHVCNKDTYLPLLGMKELSDNYFNCDIQYSNVPLKKSQSSLSLKRNCLLVGYIGGKFKVGRTIDLSSDKCISLRSEVIPFSLKNNDIVSEEFLLRNFIFNDNVKEQARMLSKGITISRLTKQDLLDIEIVVPTREEQNRLAVADSKSNISESEQKLKKAHEEYVKMLRQRKHRIQQVMNEFAPAFSLLNKCRKKHDGVLHDNDVVASRTGETVENYFDKLDMVLTKVENLITRLVDKEVWGKTKIIDIDKYIDDIPSQHLSDRFDIKAFHNRDFEIYEEGEEADLNDSRLVQINEDDLETLFDNIIANALKWGFTDESRNDYRIRIEVSDSVIEGQKSVLIVVSNNGTPIHTSVDRSRFFEWGYGTGTGIGTSELKDIVEHYGGTICLREYPKDQAGFCTSYEIVLPIMINE